MLGQVECRWAGCELGDGGRGKLKRRARGAGQDGAGVTAPGSVWQGSSLGPGWARLGLAARVWGLRDWLRQAWNNHRLAP